MTENSDVLIVGAGPTGLVLALWLTRLGVRVRIIDKTSEPGMTSRALAVQARTLELYRQVGLADAVVTRGRKMTAINLWPAVNRSLTSSSGTWARISARFLGDAVNLAWKIANVVHGRADFSLLDTYEPERIAFARRLVVKLPIRRSPP